MRVPAEVTHSSQPDRPLAHSSKTEGMELLCWALLKQLYPFPTLPGSRIAARSSQAARALTPSCPQAKWMHRALLVSSACSNSAYTLLEQPRRLRGAETAPLPFPPAAAAGGVPQASAAFAGRDAAEDNAVCLPGRSLAMPRCTHPMRA